MAKKLYKRINKSEEQMWSCSQGTSPCCWDCEIPKIHVMGGKRTEGSCRDCSYELQHSSGLSTAIPHG